MNTINYQGMSGGFCILKEYWMRILTQTETDQTDHNGETINKDNFENEPLGITCATVKANSGPTIDEKTFADRKSFWLPLTYKTQLDEGTLNLWNTTDTTLQGYEITDEFHGWTHWKIYMSGASNMIAVKAQL